MTQLAERLDAIAVTYNLHDDFDLQSNAVEREMIGRSGHGKALLEIGCGWGDMTAHFAPRFGRVVALDGSAEFAHRTGERCARYPWVEVKHALVEEFETDERFEDIVIAHVLEHVDDPVGVLRKLEGWLAPAGQIHLIVPNARSLHRRIGKAMGLLKRLDDFSPRDVQLGHMRVYDRELLTRHVEQAGLRVAETRGILVKPLSNAQMQTWDPAVIRALFEVGKDEPDLCNELYLRCERA